MNHIILLMAVIGLAALAIGIFNEARRIIHRREPDLADLDPTSDDWNRVLELEARVTEQLGPVLTARHRADRTAERLEAEAAALEESLAEEAWEAKISDYYALTTITA